MDFTDKEKNFRETTNKAVKKADKILEDAGFNTRMIVAGSYMEVNDKPKDITGSSRIYGKPGPLAFLIVKALLQTPMLMMDVMMQLAHVMESEHGKKEIQKSIKEMLNKKCGGE